MKKIRILAFVITVAFLVVLAGCAGDEPTPSAAADPPATTDATATDDPPVESADNDSATDALDPVTIRVAGDLDNQVLLEGFFNDVNSAFQAENPHITIQFDYSMDQSTLQLWLRANELPDSFWNQGNKTPVLREMVHGGFVQPIDDFIDKSLFTQDQLDYGTVDGHLYSSLPGFMDVVGVYYNRDIFEANGLELPQTLEDFENIMQTLLDNGVQPLVLAGAAEWGRVWPFWIQATLFASDASRGLLDGSNTIEHPDIITALSYYRDWIERGYFGREVVSTTSDDAMLTFTNQNSAMLMGGSWSDATITASGINFGRFIIPNEEGERIAYTGLNNFTTYSMSANTEHREAVGAYLAFLSTIEAMQMYMDNIPGPIPMPHLADRLTGITPAALEFMNFDSMGVCFFATLGMLTADGFQPGDVLMREVLPRLMTFDITAEEGARLLHEAAVYP